MTGAGQLEKVETSNAAQERAVVVTSCLLEAFLACPTKCYLLSKGEIPASNDYTAWATERVKSYRHEGIQKLTAHAQEFSNASLDAGLRKHASWRFALGKTLLAQGWQASLELVQRIPQEGATSSGQLVPIRFVPANKLSSPDKLMAAFDALVLSKVFGVKASVAKIIHGEKWSAVTVNTNSLSRVVHRAVSQSTALLSAAAPPDLILNRHCSQCEFQDRCKKKAVEKDDLSLLTHISERERVRFKGKGLFTVTQLSYTFRPRRRIKRLAGQPEKYHHALKALAIREHKIHVVGKPELHIEGTPIFFDVESLPDRDFYYLVGVRVEGQNGVEYHSLWADSATDEKRVWESFLGILSGIDRPKLMHYGSFETVFLKRMCDRYGGPSEHSAAAKAITSTTNLLSLIYGRIYFPVYSNGLKEIARFLGFEWTDPLASGLQSIAWRSQWEASHHITLRDKLIAYNADDCEALSLVARTIERLLMPEVAADKTSGLYPEIVHAEALGKNLTSKWREFKSPLADMEHINKAAYWNYQRDRVFVRSGIVARQSPKRPQRTNRCRRKAEKIVVLKAPPSCPECGKRGRRKSRLLTRAVQELVFGRDSVKRRVVQYVFQTYRCRSCGQEYGLQKWYLHGRKWGWDLVAYFVYHIVGLRIPQLTMQHSLNRLFGFNLVRSTLNNLKIKAADHYLVTKRNILERIVHGDLIHADETRANIKGHLAYVWVLTNLTEVVYILAESREGEIVQTLLKDFKGVLVSDFYAAYDTIACPQQKCLIHLMRDLNDDILHNPFDQEMKSIAIGFADLLRLIVETIDRYGLKRHFLKKHQLDVNRFYRYLDGSDFKSEVASKCKQRFAKNRDTLFTFLRYDRVPWNNNNAEHAIKAFARLRDVISGTSSKKGVDEYLTLLTVAETCEYQGLDFLAFLRSGEKDINTFASGHRRDARRQKFEESPVRNAITQLRAASVANNS
jgi:predicted RecB family nuclease